MKIAIIGSGVSGLSSGFLLSPDHEVTIFEKDSRIGGHAHTIMIDETTPVDNGFMVFNPERYPNFVGLIDGLGIESVETTMSFSVFVPGEVSFRGNFPRGVFAEPSNIINLRYLRFLRQIVRFRKVAKNELRNNPESDQTLGSFLEKYKFSGDFAKWFLYPMLSSIWSIQESEKAADFPALSTLRFLDNHKLLDQFRPRWRTIKGGSVEYVSRVAETIKANGGTILTSQQILRVTRKDEDVIVETRDGVHSFDAIVFATHADVSLQLLGDASTDEKQALEKFVYSSNTTVLHQDESILAPNKRLLAAWNYSSQPKSNDGRQPAVFTYCMNILQHIPKSIPALVSLNPGSRVAKDKIINTEQYSHPVYRLDSLDGQARIEELQGVRNTYFAGAHLGYGFHEDGVTSAVNVAKKIGVKIPWQKS